jgi:RNA polymerase sigma-70 factor (ECF subfamily)
VNAAPPPARAAPSRARASPAPADFSRLVALHQQALRAFLRRLCRNHAQADDIAQESLVIAWQRMDRFDAARDFRPFLFGIAWRRLSQSRRSLFRRMARDAAAAADDVALPDSDLRLDLAAALAALPETQRAAILMCLVHDFSHAETAEALALPLGTVKSLVARGREKLQAALGG